MKKSTPLNITVALLAFTAMASAQSTAFTYQGVLNQNGVPANGVNDLTFTLYTAPSGGLAAGTTTFNDLLITNGLFTVTLDFGEIPFIGADRWLEIAVRPGASTGAYTNLEPRQPINPTPYAIFARGVNATGLIGQITDSQLSTTFSFARTFSNPGNQFFGNGANLTSLNAPELTGTVNDGRLSANVALRNTENTFIGNQAVTSGGFEVQNVTGYGFVHGDGTRQIGTFIDSNESSLGTVTPHPLGFFANNGSASVFLNTNDNFGIGTANPATKLHVVGGGDTEISLQSATSGGRRWTLQSSDGNPVAGNGTFQIIDRTAAASRLLITTNGNVGIGTATPGRRLTVRTATSDYGIEHTDGVTRMATYVAGGNLGGQLGTFSPHPLGFFVNDGPTVMTVYTNNNVGIGTATPSAKLEVTGNTRINGRFRVNTAGSAGETMTVNLLPGDPIAAAFNNSSGNTLVVIQDPVSQGGITFAVLGGDAVKPGGGSWGSLSDARLKKNVRNLDGALQRLLALRSVSFEYKDPTARGAKAGTQNGFIAQEVEPLFPDWVSTDAKGMKMLSISGFESLTVAALRELQAEKDVQFKRIEAQNAKLQEQNQSLEQRVAALEKLINLLSVAQGGAK